MIRNKHDVHICVHDISQLTIFINDRLSKQFRIDFFYYCNKYINNKNINILNFVVNEQTKL